MKWKNLLPIIGIFIFIYLIYRIGISNIILGFKDIKLAPFLISVFLTLLVLIILTFKWGYILKKQGIGTNLSFFYLLKIYLIGIFYGLITPAKAGSLIRAYYIKNKTNKNLVEACSSIIIERALDLILILFLAIIGTLFLFSHISGLITKLVICLFFIVGICLFFISEKRSKFAFNLIFKYILPKSLKGKIESSFSSFYKNMLPSKNIVILTILTAFAWMIIALQAYFMARAFSINLPLMSTATIFLIAISVGLIPITISGLGTREATLIALFNMFNISAAKVMSMSILLVTIGLIPGLIGFLISLKEKTSKNEIFNNNSSSPK